MQLTPAAADCPVCRPWRHVDWLYIDSVCVELLGGADLEHVCAAVVSVLHHHRLGPGQSVGDAVLILVADRLSRHTGEAQHGEGHQSDGSLPSY